LTQKHHTINHHQNDPQLILTDHAVVGRDVTVLQARSRPSLLCFQVL